MKGVIYTAIAGGFDDLVAPTHRIPDVDYICFSDDPAQRSPGWHVKPFAWKDVDPNRVAKRVKILPHRYLNEYDWSLWIDGNVHITGDLAPFLETHLAQGSLQAFRHPRRSCIYREAEHCINRNKDSPALIDRQMARYRCEGMPADFGLSENNVIFRHHHESQVRKIMESWWQEIVDGSRRDQLSLSFALWKEALEPRFFFEGRALLDELHYFRRVAHRHELA
ncbi:MAG TPA: glycosyltransferase domain-containing protein [Thermoanaerobaculia bacterium]